MRELPLAPATSPPPRGGPREKSIAEKLSRAAEIIQEAIAHPDVPPHVQESMSYTLPRVEAAAKAARGD